MYYSFYLFAFLQRFNFDDFYCSFPVAGNLIDIGWFPFGFRRRLLLLANFAFADDRRRSWSTFRLVSFVIGRRRNFLLPLLSVSKLLFVLLQQFLLIFGQQFFLQWIAKIHRILLVSERFFQVIIFVNLFKLLFGIWEKKNGDWSPFLHIINYKKTTSEETFIIGNNSTQTQSKNNTKIRKFSQFFELENRTFFSGF